MPSHFNAPKQNGGDWRGVIIVSMGALSLLSGVVWWATTDKMSSLQREIEANKKDFQHSIDILKAESTSTYTRIEEVKRIDGEIASITRRLTRMGDQVLTTDKHISDTYVTKDMYIGQHGAVVEDLNRTKDNLKDVRNDFAKIYTPTDTIKELLDRIKALEARSFNEAKKDK